MNESPPSNTDALDKGKDSSVEIVADETLELEENSQTNLEEDSSQNSSPKNPRKSWLGLLLFVSIAMNAFAVWQIVFSEEQSSPSSAVAASNTRPPRPVEVTSISRGNSASKVELLGQVESPQQATIRAQTAGVVRRMLVQPGDRVRPGTTIAILDDADQKLAISQAQAQLAQQRNNLARLEVGTRPEIIGQRRAALRAAKAREEEAVDNLRRREELVKEGAIAQRLLIEARTSVDAAKAQRLETQAELSEAKAGPTREEIAAQRSNVAAAIAVVNQAKLASQRTRIRANSGGVVLERKVSPGDYLQNGGEIITLVAGRNLDIFLELPEQLSGRVSPGSRVELTARALPRWKTNATITGVVPSTDAASRRQRVRVRLNNPPSGLLPGMGITGNLLIPGNTEGFVVSRDALTRRADKWLVFAIADGTVKELEVEMIADMGEKVAISGNGLQNAQNVVLRGGDGLRDGAKVRVVGSE